MDNRKRSSKRRKRTGGKVAGGAALLILLLAGGHFGLGIGREGGGLLTGQALQGAAKTVAETYESAKETVTEGLESARELVTDGAKPTEPDETSAPETAAPSPEAPEPVQQIVIPVDDGVLTVTVREDKLLYEGREVNLAELEESLLKDYVAETSTVELQDDHAIKAAYDEVKALLERLSIPYSEGK